MYTILVIEENANIRGNLAELLELEHFEVICTEKGSKGYQLTRDIKFDLILCDTVNPASGWKQFETLTALDQLASEVPVIWLVTGAAGEELQKSNNKRPNVLLKMPFSGEELINAVQHLLPINH